MASTHKHAFHVSVPALPKACRSNQWRWGRRCRLRPRRGGSASLPARPIAVGGLEFEWGRRLILLHIKFPPTHSPGWGNIKYLRVLCGCEYKSAALRTSSSPPQWLAGVRGAFLLYILAAAHAWLVPGHLHACICWYGDATSVCSPPQSRGWASASGHSALRHTTSARRAGERQPPSVAS